MTKIIACNPENVLIVEKKKKNKYNLLKCIFTECSRLATQTQDGAVE